MVKGMNYDKLYSITYQNQKDHHHCIIFLYDTKPNPFDRDRYTWFRYYGKAPVWKLLENRRVAPTSDMQLKLL